MSVTPSKPLLNMLYNCVVMFIPCSILVVTLSASELQRLVRKENPNCIQLGVHLDIPFARLRELELQSSTKREPRVCFREMCEMWLKNEEEDRKWSVVFEALEQQNNKRLKMELERKYKGDDTGDYYEQYTVK